MEKLTESKFGKFEDFELNSLNLIKGGDKIIATGGGSRINGDYWEAWDGDTRYEFSNGSSPLTSYNIIAGGKLIAA